MYDLFIVQLISNFKYLNLTQFVHQIPFNKIQQ